MKGEEWGEFGLTDVTAPAHSCLILMVLDNERPARSVHIDNALLERLLRVKTIALLEHRKSAGKTRETERCEALKVCWL